MASFFFDFIEAVVNSGDDTSKNTFWPKVDKLFMSKALKLHVVDT